jgi:hypothetical protein
MAASRESQKTLTLCLYCACAAFLLLVPPGAAPPTARLLAELLLFGVLAAHLAEFCVVFGLCKHRLALPADRARAYQHFVPVLLYGFNHWLPMWRKNAKKE